MHIQHVPTFFINDDTLLDKIKNRLYGAPSLKKGEKYHLYKKNNYDTHEDYIIKIKSIILDQYYFVDFPKTFIDEHFYTEQELRKQKLKKLNYLK